MEKLTQKRLKELLHYDPDTGIFIRKSTGKITGTINDKGYYVLNIDRKNYQNHRLAWLYMYGYFPENELDHKNQIKTCNKIKNLREVSRSCNMRNTPNYSNNTSGVKGIGWEKNRQKWQAFIKIQNKQKRIGYYNDFDEAVCHRLAVEQCIDWAGCNSNSPAFQYVQEMLKR